MSSEVTHPRAPMFTLALSFAAGILLARYCWRPPIWIGICAVVTITSAAILASRRPRLGWLIAHLAIAALGWVTLTGQVGENSSNLAAANIDDFSGGQEVTLVAKVIREPGLLNSQPGRTQLDVETESLADASHQRVVPAGLRVSLYARWQEIENSDDGPPAPTMQLQYGDRIRFTAKLRPPKNFRNPGAFDYVAYLQRHGIVALASGKVATVEVLGNDAERIGRWQSAARRSVIAQIHRVWPERQAGLMDAMLIGERAFIDRELSTDFQKSGTYHVLVVSGMNVGILALVVFWLLRRLRFGELAASIATALLAGGYAFLCDGGAPIVRAALMLALYLFARLIYRDRSPLNAVGVAGAIVLFFDAQSFFDPSFQLTFLCVLVIAGLAAPVLERTSDPWRRATSNFQSTAYDMTLAPRVVQFRLDLRMIIERLGKLAPEGLARFIILRTVKVAIAAWEILLVSALMQIALVLPMAFYFHRATLTALPANMLVVPLTEVLMPASVVALGMSYLSQSLAYIPSLVAGWSLDAITGTVRIAGSLRVADLRLPTPSLVVSAAAILTFALAIALARRAKTVAFTSLMLLAVAAASVVLRPAQPNVNKGKLEISAIDVGQADSTLLVTPEGRTILVDAAGPLGFSRSEFDYGENVVSPYLWARGISRLDAVVISHGHSDHVGGMLTAMKNFRPRELWIGPLPETAPIKHVLDFARQSHMLIRDLREPDEFGWNGVHVRVLGPPRKWIVEEKIRNNDSLALLFRYGETSVLMEGDSEKQAELRIAALRPSATVLKIAHNGSLTSTTPELLEAVKPKYAFISVGARNTFRHPRPEVLARLRERQIATYRTDTMGALTFLLDGKTVMAKTALAP